MAPLRVLHLVGSASNEFYCDLSREYAQCCLVDTAFFASQYDFLLAYVTPDGRWRFPRTLKADDLERAESMSLAEAIQWLNGAQIDVVLPHMYCIPGMTHYRSLFDLLKIPYIGNPPSLMSITAHKAKTKAIVAAAGVSVPSGQLLRRGDVPTVSPPSVVKPASADNSLGISLVREEDEYAAALRSAFEHADEVLVESFVPPGREVRCSVIVKDGELVGLPLEEFLVNSDQRPMRTYADKFPHLDANGKFRGWQKSDVKQHWIVEPSDPITAEVHRVAKQCHLALGCRHFSMFDFRIDPEGKVWFLEAGLYCSFGYGSGIPHVAKAAGMPLDVLFQIIVNETLGHR